MRRLEATCTAADTHTRNYGVQIMIQHSSSRISAGQVARHTDHQHQNLDPAGHENTSLRGLIGIEDACPLGWSAVRRLIRGMRKKTAKEKETTGGPQLS
jgi:hypothetical protein